MFTAGTRSRVVLVAILFALFLYTNSYKNVLYWDAADYWNSSIKFFKTFSHDEPFSIYNYNSSLRGYLFPLFLLPEFIFCYITKISPTTISKLLGIFWATLLFAWILPAFWQSLTGRKYRLSMTTFIFFTGFAIWSWGDYFSFTLTDFPAFTLFLLSLIWIKSKKSVVWFFAGLSFAAALNFRPVYLATVPAVLLLVAYSLYKVSGFRLLRTLFLGLGLSLVLIPQFLINAHNFKHYSPLVLGYSGSTPLYQWHLAWGMRVQKFEGATVGPNAHMKVLVVHDLKGRQLLQELTNGNAFNSMAQYGKSILKHPLDFTAIFARHLFSNLDIKYSSPYLLNNSNKGVLFSIFNFFLLLIGILMLKRIKLKPQAIFQVLALLSVVLATLPLVVEPRFIMPLHLLLITAAFSGSSPKAWWYVLKSNTSVRNQLMTICILWVISCLIFSNYVNMQAHFEPIDYFK